MSFLELQSVAKSFRGHAAVHDVSLSIERGEFVSFLGPSGCGKTTTLRMVAGFEAPTAGQIRIGSKDVTGLRPAHRNVGMVFQNYALFPNLNVAANVGFGLRVARLAAAAIEARVREMLALVKLEHLRERFPRQLSGGQQQRVALARALANRPAVLLLDEPLSALDAAIRVSLRDEIRGLQQSLGITTVYVTHDQEEALSMSDRVVVMNQGRVEQVGPPRAIYDTPRTRFVASFVGRLSVLPADILDASSGRMSVEGQPISVSPSRLADIGAGPYSIALRPEAIRLGPGGDGDNRLNGTLRQVRFLGAVVRVDVALRDTILTMDVVNDPAGPALQQGTPIVVSFAPDRAQVLAG